jgi:hypothetical protein
MGRYAVGVLALAWSAWTLAAPVKLGCLTERVQQAPSVPKAWVVTFDEQAKSASLFASEAGGLLPGTDVAIDSGMIMFKVDSTAGRGTVAIERGTGTMMVSIDGTPIANILAKCRRQESAF